MTLSLAHDGAALPRFEYDSYSVIKSLAVCRQCPTRYAITLADKTMRLDELDGLRAWQCTVYESGYVVCPLCLGELVVYVLNAARTDDGRLIALDAKLSVSYRNN